MSAATPSSPNGSLANRTPSGRPWHPQRRNGRQSSWRAARSSTTPSGERLEVAGLEGIASDERLAAVSAWAAGGSADELASDGAGPHGRGAALAGVSPPRSCPHRLDLRSGPPPASGADPQGATETDDDPAARRRRALPADQCLPAPGGGPADSDGPPSATSAGPPPSPPPKSPIFLLAWRQAWLKAGLPEEPADAVIAEADRPTDRLATGRPTATPAADRYFFFDYRFYGDGVPEVMVMKAATEELVETARRPELVGSQRFSNSSGASNCPATSAPASQPAGSSRRRSQPDLLTTPDSLTYLGPRSPRSSTGSPPCDLSPAKPLPAATMPMPTPRAFRPAARSGDAHRRRPELSVRGGGGGRRILQGRWPSLRRCRPQRQRRARPAARLGRRLSLRRPRPAQYTWGFRRSTIYAALLQTPCSCSWPAAGIASWEAWHRFGTPHPVAGPLMIGVATIGVVINTLAALLSSAGPPGCERARGLPSHGRRRRHLGGRRGRRDGPRSSSRARHGSIRW